MEEVGVEVEVEEVEAEEVGVEEIFGGGVRVAGTPRTVAKAGPRV